MVFDIFNDTNPPHGVKKLQKIGKMAKIHVTNRSKVQIIPMRAE
jgi:hypothetical protein